MCATCDDAHDGTVKPDLEADVEHARAATGGEVRYVEARKQRALQQLRRALRW